MIVYKGVKIFIRESGNYELRSPVNGTLRIFDTLKRAKHYIDNAGALDSHAAALARNPW